MTETIIDATNNNSDGDPATKHVKMETKDSNNGNIMTETSVIPITRQTEFRDGTTSFSHHATVVKPAMPSNGETLDNRPLQSHNSQSENRSPYGSDYANANFYRSNSADNDRYIQQRNVSLNEGIQIPIVGYEVMEERARFTIYKLKVEDPSTKQSWLVFRRYTDFVRLYSRLKSENININLPLPSKRWFRDNFEPAFLEERVRGLQTFVNAVLRRMSSNKIVRDFFCIDEPPQEFNYQPEAQAVYGALEDSICSLKTQLKQKDTTILYLQQRVAKLEQIMSKCSNCRASEDL